jgi:hypothetical protein
MTDPRYQGDIRIGSVSGTGFAVGPGAHAHVSYGSSSGGADLAVAVRELRAQLAGLDQSDDETAERVALAEKRLELLERAVGEKSEPSRIKRLFNGVVDAVGDVAKLAGGLAALQAAVAPFLR